MFDGDHYLSVFLGGWNSEAVVQEYIDDSDTTKSVIAPTSSGEPVAKKARIDDENVDPASAAASFSSLSSHPSSSSSLSGGTVFNFYIHR